MRIVDGKRFLKKDIEAATKIDNDGWDYYDGRNYQWYTLLYNPDCGLVILGASNSGDCYGDCGTKYFSSPQSFHQWAIENDKSVEALLGDIDETNAVAMKFVDELFRNGKENC